MFTYIFMEMKSACLLRPRVLEFSSTNLTQQTLCPASSFFFFYFLFSLFGAGGRENGTRNRSGQGSIDSWEALLIFLLSCPFRLSFPCCKTCLFTYQLRKTTPNNIPVRRTCWWDHRTSRCQFPAFSLQSFPSLRRHSLLFCRLLPFLKKSSYKDPYGESNPAIWKYEGLLLSGSRKDWALSLRESVPLCTGIALNIIQGFSGLWLEFLGPTLIKTIKENALVKYFLCNLIFLKKIAVRSY